MKTLFVLVAVAVAAANALVLRSGDRGPTQPMLPLDCSDPLQFTADKENLCWYYRCTPQGIRTWPCALGTHVHSNTRVTRFNPCTERFPIEGMYDCKRRNPDSGSLCNAWQLNCLNGGTPRSEGSLCWCECPPAWLGAHDCSLSTRNRTTPIVDYHTCPPVDWCANALPNGRNPCRNNGTCINHCTNFVCYCQRAFSKDRLCSAFSCSSADANCPPGLSCNRGVNGRDEFYTCM